MAGLRGECAVSVLRWIVTVIAALLSVAVLVFVAMEILRDFLTGLVLLGGAVCLLAAVWGPLLWWWTGDATWVVGILGPLVAFGLLPVLDAAEGRNRRIWG
jgi:hypothetical protein